MRIPRLKDSPSFLGVVTLFCSSTHLLYEPFGWYLKPFTAKRPDACNVALAQNREDPHGLSTATSLTLSRINGTPREAN